KQKETPSPSTETTESTPIRRKKATATRGLHIQNTPPSDNPPTTPQTETTNVQNTRNLSPVIENDSTQIAAVKAVKIKDKIGKNPETRTKNKTIYKKKQQVEKKEKEQVNKRKRDEKAKKEEQVKKKMVKLKGKKKVENDDKDFVEEEQHDEEDDNKDFESKFKSLRERTIVLPLYDATQSLSPERKSKIREMGFASMLDFPFQKIPGKLPYFVLKNLNTEKMEVSLPTGSKIKITPKKIWEVLGIPMGKKKLESDSPRDFNDEFLTAFKKQFEGKKYLTTIDLSKLIQRTTNINFMFQINYLMLFENCMINCDKTSRLK
ncbi:hypothetical protein Tco_1529915, partial [Tanacetum coccineum]